MRALVWRQVLGAARLPVVWGAVLFHVAALVAFLLVWGTGIPLADARSPFEQFASAQSALVLLVLPWVVARCTTVADRDAFLRLAVRSTDRPAMLMLGAGAGVALLAIAVAATGLPLALLSHQISDAPALQLMAAQMRTAAVAACAATLTLVAVSASGSRLAGWVMGAAAATVMVWLVPAGARGTVLLSLFAAVVTVAAAQHAQRFWQYRAEYRA
jgi:hypothetical protein